MLPQALDQAGGELEDGAERPWLRWYDTEVPRHIDYPHLPLYRLLDDAADSYPDRICTHFLGARLTYREIRARSDALAVALRSMGVRRGERVALLLPNSPAFLIAYFAALKAGAAVVPLNPLFTEYELRAQMSDAAIRTVVTIPLFLAKVAAVRGAERALDGMRILYSKLADFLPWPKSLFMGYQERKQLRAARCPDALDMAPLWQRPLPADFHPETVDPGDLAVLIYSGGTTGAAKGIMLSHYACVANAYQAAAWVQFTADRLGRMLAVLPLFHGFGMSMTMNAPLTAAAEIVLLPRFAVREVLKTIQRYRPEFFIGVPTMFVAFNNLPDVDRYDLHSVQGIFVGAAPLTRAVKEAFEARTGARMIEGYGLTESVTAIMANPFHGTHKVGSIGIPFPDVDMKIVSLEDGHDVPPGTFGEILLRSPTIMLGYYGKPEETSRTLVDGWLHTGDIGYMDQDGYFYITDRLKELIIVGGFNVFPREIDEVIHAHPKVKEGVCLGLPDAYKGERIKAYIVLKEGQAATLDEFDAYFRQRLAPYKVPSEIEFRSELPKSMIGKVLRRTLRDEEFSKSGEGRVLRRALPGEELRNEVLSKGEESADERR